MTPGGYRLVADRSIVCHVVAGRSYPSRVRSTNLCGQISNRDLDPKCSNAFLPQLVIATFGRMAKRVSDPNSNRVSTRNVQTRLPHQIGRSPISVECQNAFLTQTRITNMDKHRGMNGWVREFILRRLEAFRYPPVGATHTKCSPISKYSFNPIPKLRIPKSVCPRWPEPKRLFHTTCRISNLDG